jgi:hypothetical protein
VAERRNSTRLSFGDRASVATASLVGVLLGGAVAGAIDVGVRRLLLASLAAEVSVRDVDTLSPAMIRGIVGTSVALTTYILLRSSVWAVQLEQRRSKIASTVAPPWVALATVAALYGGGWTFLFFHTSKSLFYQDDVTARLLGVGVVAAWAGALAGTIPVSAARGRPVWPWAFAAMIALSVIAGPQWLSWPPALPFPRRASRPIPENPEVTARNAALREQPLERSQGGLWTVTTEDFNTLVAVTHEGTLYYDDSRGRLRAREISGADQLFYDPHNGQARFGPGAISADGTIYAPFAGRVLALTARGEKLWEYYPGIDAERRILGLAADGTIYVGVGSGADSTLRAIDPAGHEKWAVTDPASAAGVGESGVVYAAAYKYLSAYSPDGTRQWRVVDVDFTGQPAIGADGTLYVAGRHELTAIGSDGSTRWVAKIAPYDDRLLAETPVIDQQGTIYVVNSNLYAVGADGRVRWHWIAARFLEHGPLLASDGTIVVSDILAHVYGITPDGKKKWEYTAKPQIRTLTMTDSGVIYVGSELEITALRLENTTLMASPWPLGRHDPQQTARAGR